MTDIDRLRKLSGISEDNDNSTLEKIQKGISNYVRQENDHHWPFGFERELAEFIQAELEKDETVDNMPQWGERT